MKGFLAGLLMLIYGFMSKSLHPYISSKLNNLSFISAAVLSLTILSSTTAKEYKILYSSYNDKEYIDMIFLVIIFVINSYFLLYALHYLKDDILFSIKKIMIKFNFFGLSS